MYTVGSENECCPSMTRLLQGTRLQVEETTAALSFAILPFSLRFCPCGLHQQGKFEDAELFDNSQNGRCTG